jgi:cell division protein FtsL
MVGLLACLGLALVASQTLVAYTGYRVVELKAELGALQGEGQRLDLEIARLSSPDRIEKEAVERLGMCAPGEVRMVAMEVPDPSRDLATESRQGFWRTLAGTLLRGIGRAVAGSP